MRDRDDIKVHTSSHSFSEHAQSLISQLILRKVELRQVLLSDHGVPDRVTLLFSQLMLH